MKRNASRLVSTLLVLCLTLALLPGSALAVETSGGLTAFVLTDDEGGDHTYYQLRDLGKALGFNVGWSAERGVFIESDKPYTDAD